VNENLAAQLWPAASPLGRCVRVLDARGACFEVIGVARNARRMRIREPPSPAVFFPLWALPVPEHDMVFVIVRSDPSNVPLVAQVLRQELASEFPSQGRLVRRLAEIIAPQQRPARAIASLVIALAALGTVITLLGLYGDVRHAITRRRREIGIRLAIGAAPRSLFISIVILELRYVLAGIVAGVLVAFWIGHFLSALLYNVSPHDPQNALLVAFVVALAAALAIAIPALRATRADFALALREE